MSNQIQPLEIIKKIKASLSKINESVRDGEEYFFEFPAGTFWSVNHWIDANDATKKYNLFLYPKYKGSLHGLVGGPFGEEGIEYVTFRTSIGAGEPDEYEGELVSLYEKVREKHFGVDDIFKKVMES